MEDYEALNKMVRKHKAALTRAKKVGPEAVLKAVEAAYADFNAGLWPDGWHTWEIAKNDARMEIDRKNWTNKWV